MIESQQIRDLPINGSYTHGSVTAFAQDFSDNASGGKHWQSYAQGFGHPVADTPLKDFDFYAQHRLRASANLNIDLGLRYEYASLPQPKIVNPDYPQTGRIPERKRNIGPRIGVAYSLNSKTALRAGYGVFHARYQTGLIQSLFENNGVYQQALALNASADLPAGPVFPNVLAPASPAPNGTAILFAARDFRMPYTEQGDVAVERQLAADIGLTVSYLWSRGAHLTAVRDFNVGPEGPGITYTIRGSGNAVAGTYTTPSYLLSNRVDKRYTRVDQIDSGSNSYYDGLVVQLRKRLTNGLFWFGGLHMVARD